MKSGERQNMKGRGIYFGGGDGELNEVQVVVVMLIVVLILGLM